MSNLTKILVMLSLILSSTIPAIASQDTVDASPYAAQVDNSQFNDYDTELTPEEIAEAEAAAAACCGSMFVMIIFVVVVPLVVLILNIILLIWVAKDAKARNLDGAGMWMAIVFFLGPLGLVIYIFSRPQGNLISCRTCGNKRLQVSAKCPHCGN